MNILYQAHSGLRYLVLLVGVVALVVLAYGVATRRPVGAARGLTAAFTGLLDLQILLGVGLVTMLLAAAAAHVSSVMAKRAADERRALTIRLVGVVLTLGLIAAGITAIGRGLFASAPMTVGG